MEQSVAVVHYIVGNSRFYDVMVPTERIYRDIMRGGGFRNVVVEPLRKRSSKKELFEFLVSGTFCTIPSADTHPNNGSELAK
ncbi:MAG: hypothetical protein ACP5I8_12920 [Phycisphaerae bacterium]